MERDAVTAAWNAEGPRCRPGRRMGGPARPDGGRQDPLPYLLSYSVLPGVAARRLGEGEARPLLAGSTRKQRLNAQLKDREPFYRLADYEVAAGKRPAAEVAAEVMALARRHGGWQWACP